MHPGSPFSLLLGSVLLALSASFPASAAPLASDAGLVSLPLERIHFVRDDIPTDVQLEQHRNRAHKRFARMTGSEAPSDAELANNLRRRMIIPPHDPTRPTVHRRYNHDAHALTGDEDWVPLNSGLEKRYNQQTHALTGEEKWTPLNSVQRRYNQQTHELSGFERWTLLDPNAEAAAAAAPKVNLAVANTLAAGETTAKGFSADAVAAQGQGLVAANAPTTANTLGLDIEANDVGYIATIQMGTPPKDFKLLMDSGSADTWVGSEVKCANSDKGGDCGKHTFLGPTSSTFVDTGKPFAVKYGSGAVSGNQVVDNIVVAGLALKNHSFGVATTESDQFASNGTPFDGLVGLAQSTLSQQKVLTPPEALAKNGLIKSAVVSYRISRAQDKKSNGQVTFGGIDPTTIDAKTLVTIPNVSKQGFWEAPFTISVGGKDIGLKDRTAILDTGTTLILAPEADATALHTQIPGAKSDGRGGFAIPCTTTAQVAFTFGAQTYTIDSRDLLFAPIDPNNLAGSCLSAISSGQLGGPNAWLVGDVFLKNVIFSTDVTKNQVALAKLAP